MNIIVADTAFNEIANLLGDAVLKRMNDREMLGLPIINPDAFDLFISYKAADSNFYSEGFYYARGPQDAQLGGGLTYSFSKPYIGIGLLQLLPDSALQKISLGHYQLSHRILYTVLDTLNTACRFGRYTHLPFDELQSHSCEQMEMDLDDVDLEPCKKEKALSAIRNWSKMRSLIIENMDRLIESFDEEAAFFPWEGEDMRDILHHEIDHLVYFHSRVYADLQAKIRKLHAVRLDSGLPLGVSLDDFIEMYNSYLHAEITFDSLREPHAYCAQKFFSPFSSSVSEEELYQIYRNVYLYGLDGRGYINCYPPHLANIADLKKNKPIRKRVVPDTHRWQQYFLEMDFNPEETGKLCQRLKGIQKSLRTGARAAIESLTYAYTHDPTLIKRAHEEGQTLSEYLKICSAKQ